LHSFVEGHFLIRESDLGIRRNVILGPKEECYQTRVWAVEFLAYGIVAWFAAMVEQLQAPKARVPRPRCAVDQQGIFEVEFSLVHAMVQRIVFPWPDPFKRAKVRCQESASRYEGGGLVPLVRPIDVEGQVSSGVGVNCGAPSLEFLISVKTI
jgi:hypothetical protein